MKRLRSQAGQMTIEMILISVVLGAIALSFSRFAQNNNLLADVVEGPWKPIQGMIESGVWQTAEKAKASHPSQKGRHSSNKGQDIAGS